MVLHEQARAAGLLSETDWSHFSMMTPTLKHPTIPARALRNTIYWAYISFYLRPRRLWQELRSGHFYCARRAPKGLLELALHRQHTGTPECFHARVGQSPRNGLTRRRLMCYNPDNGASVDGHAARSQQA